MNKNIDQLSFEGYYPYFDGDKQAIVQAKYGEDHILLIDSNEEVHLVKVIGDNVLFIDLQELVS